MENPVRSISVEELINELYVDEYERRITKTLYKYVKNTFLPRWETTRYALLDPKVNAYVSGGFVRWLFLCAKKIKNVNWKTHESWKTNAEASLLTKVKNYFIESKSITDEEVARHMLMVYLSAMTGDIDIYFYSKKDYDNAILYTQGGDAGIRTTINETIFATSFCFPFIKDHQKICKCGGDRMFVQYIKYVFGNEKEILDTFDITNARMSLNFKTDTVLLDEKLIEYENKNIISLLKHSLNQPYVVNRVHKYVTKHGYTTIDKENGSFKFFVEWCHNNLKPNSTNLHPLLTEGKINEQRNKLHELMNHSSLIDIKDLPLLLGVANIVIPGMYFSDCGDGWGSTYHEPIEMDAALSALQRRKPGR